MALLPSGARSQCPRGAGQISFLEISRTRRGVRAAILGVPPLIAGLYGMNLENIPGLHWRFGHPAATAFVLLACILLYRGFKRSGWL